MCQFITLIVPTDDANAVRAVMERHGRAARPLDNPSIRKVLLPGERQYLTTSGHCDCGTVLIPSPDTFEDDLARKTARLARTGWSPAKIARAVEGQRKAHARPPRVSPPDSLDLWEAVLGDLGQALKLPHAGLLVRMYSGSPNTDAFIASRRQVPRNIQPRAALGSLQEDEITVFPL